MAILNVPFDPHVTRCSALCESTFHDPYGRVIYPGNRNITNPPPGMLGFPIDLVFTHFPQLPLHPFISEVSLFLLVLLLTFARS